MSSARSEPVHAAGRLLADRADLPVLFAWPSEDRVFPVGNAQRYAEALPDASVTLIPDAYSFTPEDQPARLADALAVFAATA
jgi:pimeloyl-ACP methyl ester carboxylesterase